KNSIATSLFRFFIHPPSRHRTIVAALHVPHFSPEAHTYIIYACARARGQQRNGLPAVKFITR
ncbi:MAG: hypothetical protein J1F25_05390, partial [Prevotellaceae bacterium]|nr:hypothetical protein [Prevotellaceae bacterium]